VITLEDRALIRRLAAEGVPNTRIAERLGISRTTVIKAVNSAAPPRYERKPRPTSFTVVEPRVRALLAQTPDMPATVLAERVGWEGSIRWFSENVKQLRPEHRCLTPRPTRRLSPPRNSWASPPACHRGNVCRRLTRHGFWKHSTLTSRRGLSGNTRTESAVILR